MRILIILVDLSFVFGLRLRDCFLKTFQDTDSTDYTDATRTEKFP